MRLPFDRSFVMTRPSSGLNTMVKKTVSHLTNHLTISLVSYHGKGGSSKKSGSAS